MAKKICPIRPKNLDDLISYLERLSQRVDVIEIWLDNISTEILAREKKYEEIFRKTNIPLLGVCKIPAHGGNFSGTESDRLQVLDIFLEFGGRWVDLDIATTEKGQIKKIPAKNLWLSFHDFSNADIKVLKKNLEYMRSWNPFLYKFSVTPNDKKSLKNFLSFAKNFPSRGIFTTMGSLGAEGRELLEPETWASFLALDEKNKTAEGQPVLE